MTVHTRVPFTSYWSGGGEEKDDYKEEERGGIAQGDSLNLQESSNPAKAQGRLRLEGLQRARAEDQDDVK